MDNKTTILNPVEQVDFHLKFGGAATAEIIKPDLVFEPVINLFKKLAAGPYFWFIADPTRGINHSAGGMIEDIVPLSEKEFINSSPDILFKHTHPEDIRQMFAFTRHWLSYFLALPPERKAHVRPTIYLRLLTCNQLYKWVMVQYADHIMDKEGRMLYALTLVTDISHIKKEGTSMMSILDAYDDSCQLFLCSNDKAIPNTNTVLPKISPREIEVLRLLTIGYSSKQIAADLHIAIKTIDNHRQSLLRKTSTKSTGELVAYGINMGFV